MEGSVGKVSARRIFGYLHRSARVLAFAVGMLRDRYAYRERMGWLWSGYSYDGSEGKIRSEDDDEFEGEMKKYYDDGAEPCAWLSARNLELCLTTFRRMPTENVEG